MEQTALYRTVWRWHFYAGLLVIPLVLILSVTGAAYLFKPQIDRWEERDYRGLSMEGAVSPAIQLEAALSAWPGSRFDAYRLPEHQGDAAAILLAPADGTPQREVFVSPQGEVMGDRPAGGQVSATIARLHSSLLLGKAGNWTVELAASWAIVMILTGLYLWWPRGRGPGGVLWPRLALRGRAFWRDMHAVTGFWVSGLALVLLFTGLPWAGVWGSAFATVRAELGLVKGVQDWKTGSGGKVDHSSHGHAGHHGPMPVHDGGAAASIPAPVFELYVARAHAEELAFPALVLPPGAPQRFGPPTGKDVWTIKSEAQNRPLNRSIAYDASTGSEVSRSGFADKHPIDRIVNYGIAWHEGQLLGWFNQLVGVFTAIMLATVSISGFAMWRRRKPDFSLGAPPLPPRRVTGAGIVAATIILAALLPLFAISLVFFWLAEKLVLSRIRPLALWLGLTRPQSAT